MTDARFKGLTLCWHRDRSSPAKRLFLYLNTPICTECVRAFCKGQGAGNRYEVLPQKINQTLKQYAIFTVRNALSLPAVELFNIFGKKKKKVMKVKESLQRVICELAGEK